MPARHQHVVSSQSSDTELAVRLNLVQRIKSTDRNDRLQAVAEFKAEASRKQWSAAFQDLFRTFETEKASYLKNPSRGEASMLRTAAGIHDLVDGSVTLLRASQVKVIVTHLMNSLLPHGASDVLLPLFAKYMQALNALLAYTPHVDHLYDFWPRILTFCLDLLAILQSKPHYVDTSAREVLTCIYSLFKASNPPLQSHSLNLLIDLLLTHLRKTCSTVSVSQRDSLALLNQLAFKFLLSDIRLSQRLLSSVFAILPRLWCLSSPQLRHQIIIFLSITRHHSRHLLTQHSSSICNDFENLFSEITREYKARSTRDRLTLHDIHIHAASDSSAHVFYLPPAGSFQLRRGNLDAEAKWMTLYTVAWIAITMDQIQTKHAANQTGHHQEDHAPKPKRPRLQYYFDECLQDCLSLNPHLQTPSLQIFAVIAALRTLSAADIEKVLEGLVPALSAANPDVQSWAFLVLANCALQRSATDDTLTPHWSRIWDLAFREISAQLTARASCNLLDILLRRKLISDSSALQHLDNVLQLSEITGPGTFADSTVSFWFTVATTIAREQPASAKALPSKILRWFFSKWTPSAVDDEFYIRNTATHLNTFDLLRALSFCLSKDLRGPIISNSPYPAGPISHAWASLAQNMSLVQFLLLDNTSSFAPLVCLSESDFQPLLKDTVDSHLLHLVAEYCDSQMAKVHEKIGNTDPDRFVNRVTPHIAQLLTGLILVSDTVRHALKQDLVRTQSLQDHLRIVTDVLLRCLQISPDSSLTDAVLSSFTDILPSCLLSPPSHLPYVMVQVANHLVSTNSSIVNSQRGGGTRNTDDMEPDDEFEATGAEEITAQKLMQHADIVSYQLWDSVSFRLCSQAYLSVVSMLYNLYDLTTLDRDFSDHLLNYILALPSDSFICSWLSLRELLKLALFSSGQKATLLEYSSKTLLEAYDFERNGQALSTHLELLALFTSNFNQIPIALETYEWFISVAIENEFLAPYTTISLINLLFTLLETFGPEFAPEESSLPTAQDLILRFLSVNASTTAFISNRLHVIFDKVEPQSQEQLFERVCQHLPIQEGNIETLATRLLCISSLASQSQILIRRAVYRIFESAGQVKETLDYACHCISKLAEVTRVETEKELFRSLAPQIIFTWLQNSSWNLIPFAVFKYNSLLELLHDIEDEAVAQAFINENSNFLDQLTELTGKSALMLVTGSFARVAAYCFAADEQHRRVGDESQGDFEPKLRALVDQKQYITLLRKHRPLIVSTLFAAAKNQDDATFTKMLSRDYPDENGPASTLQEMRTVDSGSDQLVPDQQPNFRLIYITPSLARLCRRLNQSASNLWSEGLFVFIATYLLSSIKPFLGSLHSCAILRRLQVVIALAANHSRSGYSVRLILQSLIPYVRDGVCSGTAISISKFVLTSGTDLQCQISYLAGYGLYTKISLQEVLNAVSASTGSISQHQVRLENFLSWIDQYCHTLLSKDKELPLSKRLRKCFEIDSTSADILHFVFADQAAEAPILPAVAHQNIVDKLCATFKPNDGSGIADFQQETALAQPLWNICSSESQANNDFKIWAARIIGKAQAVAGDTGLLARSRMDASKDSFVQVFNTGAGLGDKSTMAILGQLCQTLDSSNRLEAKYAEQAMRVIVNSNALKHVEKHLEHLMSHGLTQSLLISSTDSPITTKLLSPRPWYKPADCFPVLLDDWLYDTILFYVMGSKNQFLTALGVYLSGVRRCAIELFPEILHLLFLENKGPEFAKYWSDLFSRFFLQMKPDHAASAKVLIRVILFLRQHPVVKEATIQNSLQWLNVNSVLISRAAESCGMHATALLFAETAGSNSKASTSGKRRSQISALAEPKEEIPHDLLASIYRNINEPDSFYGVHQSTSLEAVLERLTYENDGFKSLLFTGAALDSKLRLHIKPSVIDSKRVFNALSQLNLNSLALTVNQNSSSGNDSTTSSSSDGLLSIARKLEQWDVVGFNTSRSNEGATLQLFQILHAASPTSNLAQDVEAVLLSQLENTISREPGSKVMQTSLETLEVLCEIDGIIQTARDSSLKDAWALYQKRKNEELKSSQSPSALLLSCRETFLSVLSKNSFLQSLLKVEEKEARLLQCSCLIETSQLNTAAKKSHPALSTVTYLKNLLPVFESVGINDARPKVFEAISGVLWGMGEETAAIKILQDLINNTSDKKHERRPSLLAQLGNYIAKARLETVDEVLSHYLGPAVEGLNRNFNGPEAGGVLHNYALYCDMQLHDSDFREDFIRISEARDKKRKEMEEYKVAIMQSHGIDKDKLSREYRKAMKWYELDSEEYNRLNEARLKMIKEALENYLKSLAASDDFDSDALRLFSMWIEYSADANAKASDVVARNIFKVPTAKFAVLMNQLASILQVEKSTFNQTVQTLIYRICENHPYHGLHHIFAGINTTHAHPDKASESRKAGMKLIAKSLASSQCAAQDVWARVSRADKIYHELAMDKDKHARHRAGMEISLSSTSVSNTMLIKVPTLEIPPATLDIPLRKDSVYTNLPVIVGYAPKMSIAGGLSAPKIVTAKASNGLDYRELYKGGNDDLRQDAIMEQVFDQVSLLLKKHAATRERKLHIRTYKVLPLSVGSGIIEFVRNTIPLGDYINPAHEKYFPKDLRWSACREELHQVQQQTKDPKYIVPVYKKITERFHPVLQFFFLERFLEPDEWFYRRLAYTRTTAAISILGFVLGLGDRHCQNILLDQKTGEAVHIDLGVAFEAGRILPVPEVVPFRLTPDIVSAMGYTKTEGVFRRCCEFTLEALREESESIMTLLNVLRYDPLVNWSISPLRAKRMQNNNNAERKAGEAESDDGDMANDKINAEHEGQAGRALMVVERKLSRMLSTSATVNELIKQASDEENLALLYPGWAPWA